MPPLVKSSEPCWQVEPVLIYGEKRLAAPGIETEFHLEDRRFVEQVV